MGFIDQTPTPVDRPERFETYGQREKRDIEIGRKLLRETDSIDIYDKKYRDGLSKIGITQKKKESLFNKLKREERNTMKCLMEEIDKLEKIKSNIKHLKNSLRRINTDIKKGFDDDVNINMSFVSKPSKGIPYIKCRVWWDGGSDGKGGQREVQVGHISSIIDIINSYIERKDEGFPKRKLSEDLKELSWEEFKENRKLMKLLRVISKPIFKGYLLGKLSSRRTLGYRIRTKDMSGVSKYYDGQLLNGKQHHLDQTEIDTIIKKQTEHEDLEWYKTLMKNKKYK
jgi:hypothetical protein